MSLITRAIPGLFGGVSQSVPAMRHPTQCEEQINGLSTVVSGLFKRPGSKHITQLPLSWATGTAESAIGNVHCHVVDQGTRGRWQLMLGTAGLTVVNLDTGATEPVVYQDAAGNASTLPAYLNATDPSTAFRTITVADTTFIVNSEKVVGTVNTDGSSQPVHRFFYVRQAVPGHTYRVYANSQVGTTSLPTTGTINVDAVINGLVTDLQSKGFSMNSYATAGLILIAGPFSNYSVADTYGNSAIIAVGPLDPVRKFSDLPPWFPPGYRIPILGESAGADVDPYYVEFSGGQWVETRKYGIATGLNAATMPHKVFRSGGTWYVRPIVWDSRLVGDDVTNPMPSFVGRNIRDIFFYRNRLGFLAGDSVCMSRAGEYYNFFAKTARDVLDTDPIDLGGSAESVERLDWAVPFNEQLIIWATNKQQFSLAGGDLLSPNTARLVPTTAFESVNTARPKQLGNRIVFPSTINGYTQMSLFRVAQDTVSTTAEPLTDHVPTYIPISPRSIELSQTAQMLAVVPPGKGTDLYVFKYEDDGDKLTQKAWQKFTFPGGIVKAHFSGQTLFITTLYRNATSAGDHVLALESLDFNPTAVDDVLSFGMRLDRRVFVAGAAPSGTFGEYLVTAQMPYSPDLKVFRYVGTGDPVELTVVGTPTVGTSAGKATVTLRVKAPAGTGTFVVGTKYRFSYTFTEVFMRDAEGVPVMDAKLKLSRVLVRYVKTGFFKAIVKTKAQGAYEYPFAGQGVGLPGQLLGAQPVLVSGDFHIPAHAPAQGTKVTLESDSHLPCCFPYAEWRGNLTMKSSR